MNRRNDTEGALQEVKEAFGRLYGIIRRLRGPDGCAWDRKQTPESLRGSLIEETYECISAIDEEDTANLEEELGDLYLLLTMIGYMREQESAFTVADVLKGIGEKLVRRHPHVFGGEKKDDVGEILEQWDRIKSHVEGKQTVDSRLERVPRTLPPLDRAHAVQKAAAKVGFDWDSASPVWDKLREEMKELEEAAAARESGEIEAELGDLLFTVVNLCRFLDVDPSVALNRTNRRFSLRFTRMEEEIRREGRDMESMSLQEMDAVWDRIKKREDDRSA